IIPFTFLYLLCSMTGYGQNDTIIYAHRGFRGLMRESTIAAMKNAIDLGADVLEMDIAFTKDRQAVISHDPWLDHLITLDDAAQEIPAGKGLPILGIPYAKLKTYDVGSKQHKDFPKQKNFKAHIPRLSDLIDSVETYSTKIGAKKPWYSIETKTNKSRDNISQLAPEEYVELLMKVILTKKIQDRVIIQSFDERTLEIVHRDYPAVKTMLNVSKGSLAENLSRLSFKLDYYAPVPQLIDAALVARCKELGIKLLCGNTNDKAEIDRVFALGVKELCTDYPYTHLP
ncbi:MAG: glycerophosphodiester phosphodiesterase family protein, partial [Sphingobacterium sp.]